MHLTQCTLGAARRVFSMTGDSVQSGRPNDREHANNHMGTYRNTTMSFHPSRTCACTEGSVDWPCEERIDILGKVRTKKLVGSCEQGGNSLGQNSFRVRRDARMHQRYPSMYASRGCEGRVGAVCRGKGRTTLAYIDENVRIFKTSVGLTVQVKRSSLMAS